MWRGIVAVALLIGCRGDPAPPARDQPTPTAPMRSVVPPLPESPDGAQELAALDLQIEQARTTNDREVLITTLSRRAMVRGRHQDLRDALDLSKRWTLDDNAPPRAWGVRLAILTQTHQFALADLLFDDLKRIAQDPSEWEPPSATLFEARGTADRARAYRERAVELHPTAANLTNLAANLAMRGQLDEAIALIPRGAAALRDPSPVLVSWLLVQWGRLYIQSGEPAAARQLFEEAHRRMPGYVEATVQLAGAMRATGGDPREVVAAALASEPQHPELLELAGQTSEAATAWEAYLKPPLTFAFADHAARFYLGTGRDPDTAYILANLNHVNRNTDESCSLLVDASLANAMWKDACSLAERLASGTRPQQFLAWRAFTACGQTAEATKLAQTLGIR